MQPQTQPGPPSPYPPRILYGRAGEWTRHDWQQFVDMVAAQDPMRAAQFSVLYGIRDRIDQTTIALVFVNILLALLLFARAL